MAIPARKRLKRWVLVLFVIFLLGGLHLKTMNERPVYTLEDMSYFKEIALQVEYGNGTQRIHKWMDDLKIKVIGTPTYEDLSVLESTMDTLNRLSQNLHMRYVYEYEEANLEIYFIPHTDFFAMGYADIDVLADNWGLGMIWWNQFGEINRGVVLIATDKPNALERAHLIREELTQALGLLNDSWENSDSVFYQGWGTQDYCEIDKKVIQILYDRRIKPNMTEQEIDSVLK